MRAASVRSGAPARAAGPRDARTTRSARRRPFPRTRVAAGAGTMTRVAWKRWRGPGQRTTRSRWTRLGRRAAPVTTPIPASARAQANARAPGRARAPAKARTPARARLRVAIRPRARTGQGGERAADPEAAPFTVLAGAGVPAPRTPIIGAARGARPAGMVPADHLDRIRGDSRSAAITEVVCHRIVTVRTYRHVPFRSPPYRRIRPFTPTDYASAVISPGEIR